MSVVLVIRCAVVVVGSKYGVDTNCEDWVSKVAGGVVVIGNMYGVDEDSGEYDSKVDVCVEYGLLVVVVEVVVLVSKCGVNEVDIVVVVSKIDVVCGVVVVEEDIKLVEVDRIEDVVFGNVGGKLVVVGGR